MSVRKAEQLSDDNQTHSSDNSSTRKAQKTDDAQSAAQQQQQQQSHAAAKSIDSSSSSDSDSDAEAPVASSPASTHTTDSSSMSSSAHAAPSGDCTFCCDDLTADNYVEFQGVAGGAWRPSIYCQQCIEQHFIAAQWAKYLENIAKADCAAALRRVLSAPPQINVKDAGLKCEDEGNNNGEVHAFWYASDGAVHSAKLAGSLEGAERDAFFAEKQAFLTATELQEEITKAEAAKDAPK